jgi:hypothetical protein
LGFKNEDEEDDVLLPPVRIRLGSRAESADGSAGAAAGEGIGFSAYVLLDESTAGGGSKYPALLPPPPVTVDDVEARTGAGGAGGSGSGGGGALSSESMLSTQDDRSEGL